MTPPPPWRAAWASLTSQHWASAARSDWECLCYAEFAARVPKAGSAYVYSYVSVGEFIAFTIGWNLILEYVIGTASVAKGMALYIDSLTNNTMAKTMTELAPINISFMADYPDFFAFALVMLITGDPANWFIELKDIPAEYQDKAGEGGFMPWGVAGVMAGAAKCFFGFVGFDCVATTGEEAKNPKRDIPLSIVLSLVVIFVSYFTIATDADAPFPHVFTVTGLPVIKWIVTIGAIFALCTSLLGAMFPLPRVLYAMGTDGVLFRPLA
ncbi:High affinity cationic amino acid transporter, partial [Operophtera brumata]